MINICAANFFHCKIIVASACLLPVVFCTILRLPCMTIADFTVTEFGKRLTGSVIGRHYDTTDFQCTILCVQNIKCRSYNIQRTKLICELNGKAVVDYGAEISDDAKWLYKSTNYSNLLVGPTCKEFQPCENGILCRDKCSPPYFECIYCDDKHTGLHCDIEKENDECKKNPCQNAGRCVDKRIGYRCICKSGFTGENCENDVNECNSLPCLNGGVCQNYAGGYNCTCTHGYFGTHCDVNDNCISTPCQFYQRCVSGAKTHSCVKLTNIALYKQTKQSSTYSNSTHHYGSFKAVDGKKATNFNNFSCAYTDYEEYSWWEVDFGMVHKVIGVEVTAASFDSGLQNFDITVDGKLCLHYPEHVPAHSSIKLQCSSILEGQRLRIQLNHDWSLDLCEVEVFSPDPDINECLSNPCQNGGTCIDFYKRYSCLCAVGFSGSNCETQ